MTNIVRKSLHSWKQKSEDTHSDDQCLVQYAWWCYCGAEGYKEMKVFFKELLQKHMFALMVYVESTSKGEGGSYLYHKPNIYNIKYILYIYSITEPSGAKLLNLCLFHEKYFCTLCMFDGLWFIFENKVATSKNKVATRLKVVNIQSFFVFLFFGLIFVSFLL